jgi:hypothetical protein
MLTKIEVTDKKEAELIRKGLAQSDVRAFVKVMGALTGHSHRAKVRIMTFVKDYFDEHPGKKESTNGSRQCTGSRPAAENTG